MGATAAVSATCAEQAAPLTVQPLLGDIHRKAVKCLVDDHNTIMVTWANHHYLDFVTTWVEHIKAVGVTTYLVGERCMEDCSSSGLQPPVQLTRSLQIVTLI